MKKVVKFGGSSLASAEQFQKVGKIILAEESRKYVVPSAPGKRFSNDIKVTDMLYECYALAETGESFTKELDRIKWEKNIFIIIYIIQQIIVCYKIFYFLKFYLL